MNEVRMWCRNSWVRTSVTHLTVAYRVYLAGGAMYPQPTFGNNRPKWPCNILGHKHQIGLLKHWGKITGPSGLLTNTDYYGFNTDILIILRF